MVGIPSPAMILGRTMIATDEVCSLSWLSAWVPLLSWILKTRVRQSTVPSRDRPRLTEVIDDDDDTNGPKHRVLSRRLRRK